MIRWLTIIVAVLATLYGGYWLLGRSTLQGGIEAALADMSGSSAQIAYSDWGVRGFPSRFDTTFEDISITDAASGVAWSAPWFQVLALAYKPNEVIAVWPDSQELTLGDETIHILSNSMRASAQVRPSTALTFDRATVEIQNPRIRRASDGSELAMGHLLAAARAAPEAANTYDLYLDAQSIVLPEALRMALDPAGDMPVLIRQVRLDSVATLTKPLDRFASDAPEITLRALEIREMGLIWGDVSISAIGTVAAGFDGIAQGTITFSAANWRKALDMGVKAGLIGEGFDVTYANMAQELDETPHIPDTLTVTLRFEDGKTRLGPLPLGPAPRLGL